jgi:hypothetical protein
MKRSRFFLISGILILSTLACNLSSGGSGTQPGGAATPASGNQPQSKSEPLLSAPGLGTVQLKTDTQEVGAKPLFQWEAVANAARYQLILNDASGAPYWAWDGTGTQVYLGGGESPPPADSAGPTLEAGSTWAVIAFDSSGKVIASSEVRSISP